LNFSINLNFVARGVWEREKALELPLQTGYNKPQKKQIKIPDKTQTKKSVEKDFKYLIFIHILFTIC
jgi:hypothetical protein